MEDNVHISTLERLRRGEKVECKTCHKGYYVPIDNVPIEKVHYFACSNKECNGHYQWDPVINLE